MIRTVDPRLGSDVLFRLWAMGRGDEVAAVDSTYAGASHGVVMQMGDADVLQMTRAVLSAVQLDTTPTRTGRRFGP